MRASSSAAARGKASRAAGGGLVAVVYVSEGKDASVVDALESTAERACATHGARVVNVFRDVEYNRTGFTLGAGRRTRRRGAPRRRGHGPRRARAESGGSARDRRMHGAVVDHISCHAVGDADASVAVSLSRAASARASATASACPCCSTARPSAKGAGWRISAGGTGTSAKPRGPGPAGPARTSWPAAPWTPVRPAGRASESGIVMIGATPWVCNYNVPVGATRARRPRRRARVGGEDGRGGEREDTREDTTSRAVRAEVAG